MQVAHKKEKKSLVLTRDKIALPVEAACKAKETMP